MVVSGHWLDDQLLVGTTVEEYRQTVLGQTLGLANRAMVVHVHTLGFFYPVLRRK